MSDAIAVGGAIYLGATICVLAAIYFATRRTLRPTLIPAPPGHAF